MDDGAYCNENQYQKDRALTQSTIDRQVERKLGESDVRYTKGRQIVIKALTQIDGPKSAAELEEVIGDTVPLSSLYRTLAVLEEAGILAPHYSAPGVTRYELAEWLTGHHHHLVCIDCGQVEDLPADESTERELRDLVSAVAKTVSFSETNHALEIEGQCAKCA